MTSPIEPRTARLYHATRAATLSPSHAALIALTAFATYLVVPQLVPAGIALITAQLGFALVAIAGAWLLHPTQPRAVLGLRGARPRYFAAAIAIGATTWYLNACLVALLPLPTQQARKLAALVDQPSLAGALAMFAVAPAVCEELVFRGVLARALGRPCRLATAAVLSALAFALYHLSIVQALPTLTLGVALGAIAIRADSVLPTMLAHAINNAVVIAVSRGAWPALDAWLSANPGLALLGCAATTGTGLAIALRGKP